MSHILDALRRAEDERRLGRPPGRGVITSPLRAGRRRAAPAPRWAAVAIAVVGIAALLYAFLPDDATLPVASDPDGAPPDARPASAPKPAPTAPGTADSRAPIPRAQLADGARLRSLDALFPEAEGDQGPSAAARRSGAAALEPQDLFVAGGGTSGRTGPDRDADAGIDRTAAPASTSAPSPSPPDTASETVLPAAQSDLPAFTIQVHVYDDDPERRFVRVGGRRYGIGDRLPGGGMIADIVPDGLVVRWRDRLVKRALER